MVDAFFDQTKRTTEKRVKKMYNIIFNVFLHLKGLSHFSNVFDFFFRQSPNRKLYKIVSGCCCLKLGSIIVIIKGANGKCTKRNGMDRKVLENRQILW